MSGAWVKVAEVGDVAPGTGYESGVVVDGHEVGVFCVEDRFYALGECPHERGPLAQGIIDGDEVMCLWHSARFRISSGECLIGANACRTTGDVDVEHGGDAQPLPACKRYEVRLDGDAILVRPA